MARTLFRFVGSPAPQVWCLRAECQWASSLPENFARLFHHPPRFRSKYADLFVCQEKNEAPILIKRIRVQKPADYIRRFVFSQGKREFLGSRKLAGAGLHCPPPLAFGFNLSPASRFDSLFICQFLPGTIPGNEFLAGLQNPSQRQAFLESAAGDLRTLLAKNLFHKDAHLGNTLVSPSAPQCLHWIDNDVMKFPESRRPETERILLKRFLGNARFEANEATFFKEALLQAPAN